MKYGGLCKLLWCLSTKVVFVNYCGVCKFIAVFVNYGGVCKLWGCLLKWWCL